jgi:hypothetical protein
LFSNTRYDTRSGVGDITLSANAAGLVNEMICSIVVVSEKGKAPPSHGNDGIFGTAI